MKKKNLIFIFADQWRRISVGFKDENIISPNIDAFSKESIVFNNAVSTAPLCSPSRASILTGSYPITHGVYTNCKKGLKDVWLKEDSITITDVLKKNGYNIGYIGKWHLDNPEENNEEKPKSGAREWDAYTPPGKKRHSIDYWYSYGAYDNHLKPHYWHNDNKMIEIDQWSVIHETNKAIEYIEKNKNNTFSLFLSYNPPHTPLDLLPEKYIKMYENIDINIRENVILENVIDHPKSMEKSLNFTEDEYISALKKYYGAITGIDENFGKIINKLKELKIYEDSIIVLTADHGDLMCSHGLWSKHVWFEESIGIPFMIKLGNISGENNTVLSGVDIMPTLLSLLELEIPKTVEGVDLSNSILNGEEIENNALVSAFPGQIKAIDAFKEKEINHLNYGWRALRSKTHTFVINKGYNVDDDMQKLLYDNINDEYQLNPIDILKDGENKLSKKYENELKEILIKTNDKFLD